VLVWVGIQVGLRPVKRLRQEIGARSPRICVRSTKAPYRERSRPPWSRSIAYSRRCAPRCNRSSNSLPTPRISCALHYRAAGATRSVDIGNGGGAGEEPPPDSARGDTPAGTFCQSTPDLGASGSDGQHGGKESDCGPRRHGGRSRRPVFDRALQSDIDLGIDVTPVSILADPSLIDDLLNNLVDNALKYTPPGGTVTVSAGRLTARCTSAWRTPAPGFPRPTASACGSDSSGYPTPPGMAAAWVGHRRRNCALYGAALGIAAGNGGSGARITVRFP